MHERVWSKIILSDTSRAFEEDKHFHEYTDYEYDQKNRRKLTGHLTISANGIAELDLESAGTNKGRPRKLLGELRNPVSLLVPVGILEIYNSRVEDYNEATMIDDVTICRHLCGFLKIISDIKGKFMVDEWKDHDGFVRRRVVQGKILVDPHAIEKIAIYERYAEGNKIFDRKIVGYLKCIFDNGYNRNIVIEEFLDEDGGMVSFNEIRGE